MNYPASKQIKAPISFRFKFIALPAVILLLSIIITVYFYRLLPGEVVYYFKDGVPDKWISRGAIIAWTLIPQFILALLATAIAWGTIKISTRFPQIESEWVQRILTIMGNMVARPQIILSFTRLDIFSYNSYGIHLMSLWVFALIVMIAGGIILSVLFAFAIRRISKAAPGKSFKEQQ